MMNIRRMLVTMAASFMSMLMGMPAFYRIVMVMCMVCIIMQMSMVMSDSIMDVCMAMILLHDQPHTHGHQDRGKKERPVGHFMEQDHCHRPWKFLPGQRRFVFFSEWSRPV